MWALLDLNCHMRQTRHAGKPRLVVSRRVWAVRNKGDHGRVVARSDPSKVKVGHAVTLHFEAPSDGVGESAIGHRVEENSSRVAHQSIGPA